MGLRTDELPQLCCSRCSNRHPTKRSTILGLAAEADRRVVAGLASPGVHGNLALCGSLAHVTSRIPFWTNIQPIYHCHPAEMAITAGHLAEVALSTTSSLRDRWIGANRGEPALACACWDRSSPGAHFAM